MKPGVPRSSAGRESPGGRGRVWAARVGNTGLPGRALRGREVGEGVRSGAGGAEHLHGEDALLCDEFSAKSNTASRTSSGLPGASLIVRERPPIPFNSSLR
jgi:hypothetical protein